MLLEPETYFYKLTDKESFDKITNYNSCFRTGILICHKLLYYLMIGAYSEKLKQTNAINKLSLTETERISYIALRRLLDEIRININSFPKLFITPHIFTKFIHELINDDERVNKNIFEGILDSFKEDFSYVTEEYIQKEEIINFDNFRNQYLGISETALILLKVKKRFPCILAESGKIFKEYKEDALFVNFQEMFSFVKEDERKNKVI